MNAEPAFMLHLVSQLVLRVDKDIFLEPTCQKAALYTF